MTVGATFAMATSSAATSLCASSLSLTWTDTVLKFGPSGNRQTKLPAPFELLKVVVPVWVPSSPQLTDTMLKVSWPGSLVTKLYVWLLPSSAAPSPERLTDGATLRTSTLWLAVLLDAPAASFTVIVTDVVTGPSGK